MTFPKRIYRLKHRKQAYQSNALDVLRDRIMYRNGDWTRLSEPRSIEDQIEQLVEVIAELCEKLNVDATIFNRNYEIIPENEREE